MYQREGLAAGRAGIECVLLDVVRAERIAPVDSQSERVQRTRIADRAHECGHAVFVDRQHGIQGQCGSHVVDREVKRGRDYAAVAVISSDRHQLCLIRTVAGVEGPTPRATVGSDLGHASHRSSDRHIIGQIHVAKGPRVDGGIALADRHRRIVRINGRRVVHAIDGDRHRGGVRATETVAGGIGEGVGICFPDGQFFELAIRVVAEAAVALNRQQGAGGQRDLRAHIDAAAVDCRDSHAVIIGIAVVGQHAAGRDVKDRVFVRASEIAGRLRRPVDDQYHVVVVRAGVVEDVKHRTVVGKCAAVGPTCELAYDAGAAVYVVDNHKLITRGRREAEIDAQARTAKSHHASGAEDLYLIVLGFGCCPVQIDSDLVAAVQRQIAVHYGLPGLPPGRSDLTVDDDIAAGKVSARSIMSDQAIKRCEGYLSRSCVQSGCHNCHSRGRHSFPDYINVAPTCRLHSDALHMDAKPTTGTVQSDTTAPRRPHTTAAGNHNTVLRAGAYHVDRAATGGFYNGIRSRNVNPFSRCSTGTPEYYIAGPGCRHAHTGPHSDAVPCTARAGGRDISAGGHAG